MISVYEERGIEKGIQQGIAQGIEQGIEQGILRGQREALLRLMQGKFGAVPEEIAAQVNAISSTDTLETLLLRILTANSLDEMNLPTVPSSSLSE